MLIGGFLFIYLEFSYLGSVLMITSMLIGFLWFIALNFLSVYGWDSPNVRYGRASAQWVIDPPRMCTSMKNGKEMCSQCDACHENLLCVPQDTQQLWLVLLNLQWPCDSPWNCCAHVWRKILPLWIEEQKILVHRGHLLTFI